MSQYREAPYNGEVRQDDGVTVFAVDQDGKGIAITRSEMPMRRALRQITGWLDALPGEWKVVCISSPSTIFRDLQGHRMRTPRPAQFYGEDQQPTVMVPEPQLLGLVGRSDLWRGL